MSPDLINGLRLSGIGLGVTFLALGLVILVMDLLMRIFPASAVGDGDPMLDMQAGELDEKRREETAVALAVGVALMEDRGGQEDLDPTLGTLLEE